MKLVSWNINGLRSFKAGVKGLLAELDADIICFQETKATRSVLEETSAIVEGYSAFFSFPRYQSGYSGVATFCKDAYRPFAAEEGLTELWTSSECPDSLGCYGDTSDFDSKHISSVDGEGRTVLTLHHVRCGDKVKRIAVINVYCPRADPEKPERGQIKLDFYELLKRRATTLLRNGIEVIILGDLNTSHRKIDHCDPSDDEDFDSNPGRIWLSQFLENSTTVTEDENIAGRPGQNSCFHDTYRHLHPTTEKAFTCWNTRLGARQTNYGTRIDYVFCSSALVPFLQTADILPHVLGSDHCPVEAVFRCDGVPSPRCPSMATKFWPEFAGRQQRLSAFLSKKPGDQEEAERDCRPQSSEEWEDSCAVSVELRNGGPPVKKSKNVPARTTDKSHKTAQSTLNRFFVSSNKTDVGVSKQSSRSSHGQAKLGDCGLPMVNSGTNVSGAPEPAPKRAVDVACAWKSLLKGPPVPPPCKGHGEQCVLRTVKKPGPNLGRQFFVCARPTGKSGDVNASCEFFQWVNPAKSKQRTPASSNN
ncbi:DNA-(apurinic or apyrimidinic site) endonuclease 2 isoform X1 [Ixodes scapularis]|uniref:DNA-(apurinic or apyrimidinic site) endonuclease 2 isoform X1 n=1 Tax=Ixodes scapularis TaxID=6945 RepID=UPI001C3894EA|nr:DNA-(apurinic or apyrimidinic site) endonuclease 2 isoform X1 [Ixodes scapularis]